MTKGTWYDNPHGTWYAPCTPAGTDLFDLAARTEERAWKNLLRAAAHMPYDGKQGFIERGYTVSDWTQIAKDKP